MTTEQLQNAKIEYYGKRRLKDTNTCDLCHEVEPSDKLVWLTADDFQPFDNEIVPEHLYKKYDALCEYCYTNNIKIIKD